MYDGNKNVINGFFTGFAIKTISYNIFKFIPYFQGSRKWVQ